MNAQFKEVHSRITTAREAAAFRAEKAEDPEVVAIHQVTTEVLSGLSRAYSGYLHRPITEDETK